MHLCVTFRMFFFQVDIKGVAFNFIAISIDYILTYDFLAVNFVSIFDCTGNVYRSQDTLLFLYLFVPDLLWLKCH